MPHVLPASYQPQLKEDRSRKDPGHPDTNGLLFRNSDELNDVQNSVVRGNTHIQNCGAMWDHRYEKPIHH